MVLSSDWTPPLTIAPTTRTTDSTTIQSSDERKKTSSVSFSVEDNESGVEKGAGEVKKNKVIIPLVIWMNLIKINFIFRCLNAYHIHYRGLKD
jgi:hypothetical protein